MSDSAKESTPDNNPEKEDRLIRHGDFLIALLVAAIVLLILDLLHDVKFPCLDLDLNYTALAELLLVFVVLAEGWIAIRELDQTRQQLRFEAQVRIRDYVREVQSLGFQRPTIWRDFSDQRECRTHEDQAAITTYIQLSLNSILLLLEADECGLLGEAVWKKDIENFLHRKKTRQFWEEHREFYPDSFRKRVDKMIGNQSKGPTGN